MTPDANDLCVFAVKRGYIESKEIYCNPLYPTYLSLVEKYQHSPYANGILNNHVAVNPKTDCSLLSDSSEVSFVPMANVQEKTNVVSYDMVAYETVKKGFTVFQRGDLIWAKITPCMQNGKSCIVDKMPTEIGFGSTEFHVIRKRNENVYMPFIWAILSSDDVLKAAQATFSGSAGQQRVSASFIENFPAVLPDYPVQVRLVAELEDKLNLLNDKLQRAYELLHKTPMYLIDRLGLTFDFSATQKITYATTVANIEGRIDADYYSPKFSHFRSQIEALPYRTVSVDDISEKIVSGFAAGKQDQADNLPEDQRVPHLRPFSITPEGELSFETKKYVPKSRLKSEDYCKKNEVIFNNTNSPDLVGKTTVFDSDVLCAASNHINVDQPRIVLRGREEKRIYTAIDLMYMLMFSSEVSQIAEFDSDEKNSESQVLSWGGASDYFTVFLSEKGFISKGAIEYSNVYSEVDTSAAHIFSHYLELGGVFPFHLSSTIFADPECWNVICDDNSVYQFTRKVKALPGGALFKYDNGCSVFLSYNFFSILKESNITQSRLSLDMFRAVTEKFFIEYHQDLSAIPPLANTLVQFCCHSLSNQNPEHYVCCQKAKVSSNKLVVDFEVNSSKIASDIAEAIDRSVEYSVIGELLQPLVCLSKDSYSELFEKMELTSGQKKTLGTTAVRIDYYFNPDTYEIKETDVSELSIRKQIAKICAAAGVLPGTYERRDATEIVRKIQESVVSHLEQAIRTLERDRLHILLLSALATEQLSVNLNRTGATLTEDIEEGERIKSLEKSTQLSEKAKMRKSALLYLIETNLYLVNERKEEAIDSSKLSELLSFAKWIIYLQNSSDLCFHTDSDTKLIVEDDYRIDVELGENYSQTFEKESQRRIIAEPFNLRGDNTDRDFFEKVANAFYEDLGVHFKVLESVLHHLSDSSFSHDNVEFDEIAPNVIKAKATDVLNDYLSFVVENVPVEDVKSAYDFLTIVPGQLKTICDTTHPILPIWEREKRNHCFAVRPIYMSNNDYIYSPIIMEEVRKRWIEGFLQFYPPFEIGLERTCTALYAWKNNYEHLFSSEVEVLLKESGCEYAKHDVDLRREDRRGNHPTIDVLGDYDVIGLNTTQKRIFIIECKVLQPIGSVFEHSNQQKRFFTKEKFDEKFQKRIDYFSKVAMSFFANHGYDTEGFTINPYMVVNKVFSSYYKHVQFPIVTFDELKREIQL